MTVPQSQNSNPAAGTVDRRTAEDWLRQELRATRTVTINLIQWGVTALAAVELNLYYIRRDATQRLLDSHFLKPGELLPLTRWCLGTILLSILAQIFSVYTSRIARHHLSYRNQLVNMNPSYSGIDEGAVKTGGPIHQVHVYLFWIFPLFDLTAWFLFYAGERLHISIFIPW